MIGLPPKRLIAVDGEAVEYVRGGTGSPAIVLINGSGGPIEGWHRVFAGLEPLGTVVGYNRSGVGKSSKPSAPQTASAMVATLRALLAAIDIGPPWVLVGHSFGGLVANLLARTEPTLVAGVVLLEASTPEDIRSMPALEGPIARVVNRWLGVLFPTDSRSEAANAGRSAAEVAAAPPFPAVPLTVVTGCKPALPWLVPAAAQAARAAHQRGLVGLSPLGRHVLAERSGHFPQFSEPELVVRVVADMVASIGPRASG